MALIAVAIGAITAPPSPREPVRDAASARPSGSTCSAWELALNGACERENERGNLPFSTVSRGSFSFVEPESLIGTVTSRRVLARAKPDRDARAIASFPRRSPEGVPQVFLLTARPGEDPAIERRDGTWYEALLPVRPNGTTGFLPARAVSLSSTPYRIVVDRASFRLTLWKGSEVVERMPVGLGTGQTPTPVGRFYLTSLLRPPTPNTIYGTYAYGLSGYSKVLTDWEGGGVVGLHGTNDPSSIGTKASHGCIRMHNEHIEKLVPILPLGTPIEIT